LFLYQKIKPLILRLEKINRSTGANTLVQCKEGTEEVEGETRGNGKLECDELTNVFNTSYEVYLNKEENFPFSANDQTRHDAKIIVCSSKDQLCFLPKKNENNKYVVDGKVLGKYFTNSNKGLITCSGGNGDGTCDEIAHDKVDTGHIDPGIYLDGSKDLSFIKCEITYDAEDNTTIDAYPCKVIDSNKYAYYRSFEKKLIYCNNSECIEVADKTGPISFLNGDTESKKRIIYCDGSSASTCEEVEGSNYYVDTSNPEGMNLLSCTSDSCTRVEGQHRGIYISDEGKRLIKCTNDGGCVFIVETETTASSAIAEGDHYYINGADSHTVITIVAKPEEESAASRKRAAGDFIWGTIDPKQYDIFLNDNVEGSGSQQHYFIYCNNDSSNSVVCSEIMASSTDGTDEFIDINNAKIYSKSTNYIGSPIVEGIYKLVNKDTGKIVTNTNETGSLVECTYDSSASPTTVCIYKTSDLKNYYISDNSLIINNNNNFIIKPAASMGKGYYINDANDIIQCNGSNPCSPYTLDTECTTAKIGTISSDGLCIGDDKKVSISTTQTYIINSGASGFPGLVSSIIMINVDNNKIVAVDVGSTVLYYLVDSSEFTISSSDSGNVYSCTNSVCSNIQASSNGKVYPNANTANSSSYPYIKCDKEEGATEVTCKYYKLTGTSYYCLKGIKLNSCIVDASSGSTSPCDGNQCIELTPKDGYYLPYKKDKLISCTNSNCNNPSGIKPGYYVSKDASNTLINCSSSTGSIRCDYVSNDKVNDGYYIGSTKLIKCDNKVCSEIESIKAGWYVSGEPGKAIINCTLTSIASCTSYVKPAVGWYKNAISETKALIYCQNSKSGDKITCNEMTPPNEGYYIDAAEESTTQLLSVNSNIVTFTGSSGKYYVSGEDKQLIYCTAEKCFKIIPKPNYWYLPQSTKGVIGCTSDGCVEYNLKELTKGYYLNGDEFSNNPLILIVDNDNRNVVDSYKNGWYINAGSTELNNKIIQCVNSDIPTCELKAAVTAENCSSSSTNGKFIVDSSGVLSWCINQKQQNLLDPNETTPREVFGKITGANFFSWIPENSGEVKFSIEKNSILQVFIDGYYFYKSENTLYKCIGWGSGICSPENDVVAGFYVNYENGNGKSQLIRCRDDATVLCRVNEYVENADQTKCDTSMYNVILKDSNTVAICKDENKSNAVPLKDMTIDYIYAIPNKGFPDVLQSKRYLLVNASKYSVTKREIIEEIGNCNDIVADPSTPELVCLKDGFIRKASAKDTKLSGSIKVNKSNIKAEPKYDYDTNNGYFYYDGGVLKKVFIKQSENKVDFKFECDIGSVCVRRKMGEEPIVCYQFDKGILKAQKKSESSPSAVTSKIMPGTYVICNDKTKAIKCRSEGGVVNCSEVSFSNSDVSMSGGIITYRVGGVTVQGSSFYTKFVTSQSSFSKRSSSHIKYRLNALTDISFSEKEFDDITNMFLLDYKQISNDLVVSTSESNVMGYSCDFNGDCEIIDKSGNKKYYLNTIQIGSKENAVVECGDNKCHFVNAEKGLVFENAAAYKGTEDALIVCDEKGCTISSSSPTGKLPECQYFGIPKAVIKDKSNNNSCMISSSESLLVGQHCILDDKIYTYNGSDCDVISDTGSLLFDATNRKIDPTKISENHYGASIYNCPAVGKCYSTYGYIVNGLTYSKCVTGIGCIYDDNISYTLKTSCSEAGEGALIYSGGALKLCINGSSNNNSNTYNSVTINIENNFPEAVLGDKLLISYQNNVYSLVIADGYLLVDSSKKIISSNSQTAGSLYKCNSITKNCENVSPNYGYYYSSLYNNVIECKKEGNNTVCKMSSNTVDSSSKKITNLDIEFSTSDTEKKYFYPENFPGYTVKVIAEASKYNIGVFKANNYVLLNDSEKRLATKSETKDLDGLYFCQASDSKCKKLSKDEILDGWYLSDYAEAIKCENGYCVIKDRNKQCAGEGDLITKESVPQICLTVKNQKSYSPVKLTENVGLLSELKNKNIVFPNGKTYVVVNVNSVQGIGYTDTENKDTPRGLTQCNTVTSTKCTNTDGEELTNGQYCIKEKNIYKFEVVGEEKKCSKQFTDIDINVEIFVGSSLAQATNSNGNDYVIGYSRQMYVCRKGTCEVTTGYKKYNSKIVICDYAQCKERTAVNSPSNGEMNSSNNLKVNIGTKPFTGNDEVKYYYMSGSNSFPGTETKDGFMVQVGKDYMIPYIAQTTGYYLISETGVMYSKDPLDTTNYVASENASHVYYCVSGDISCKLKDNETENVYYINAASSSDNLALIGCFNGKCRIATAEDISNEESIGKCTSVGKIVRKAKEGNELSTFGDYSICTVKGNTPVSIKRNNVKSKFMVISLERNNAFAGISIPDEDTYDTVSRNIIIENSDLFIRQYEQSGYILFSSATGEIIETPNIDKGNLYKCEYNANYDGATQKSYECKIQSNINNGWYFNEIYGDKRLIRCIKGKCMISEAKELNKCQNSGSIIYNNGFKICQTLKKQIDVNTDMKLIMNVSLLTEFPGLETNNTEILLTIKDKAAYQVKLQTNVVVRDDNIVIENTNEQGNLYQCTLDGKCNANMIPKDGYYIKKNEKGEDSELVYCHLRKCKLIPNEVNTDGYVNVKEGFRISANPKLPLIQCVKPGYALDEGFKQNGVTTCKEKEFRAGWFMSAESEDESTLIECNQELGCYEKSIGKDDDGWYINAGANSVYSISKVSNATVYPVIECNSGTCTPKIEKIENECKKGGDLISSYKICKDDSKSIDFSRVTTETYEVINNEGGFPGGASGNIVIRIANNRVTIAPEGHYYYSKDKVMYECNGNCQIIKDETRDGNYVYDKISGNLMYATCTNGECSWSENKIEGNVFLDSNGNLVVSRSTTNIDSIYECTKDTNKNIVCKQVLNESTSGYFFNNEIKDEGRQTKVLYSCIGTNCEIKESVDKCTYLGYIPNICYISYDNELSTEELSGLEPTIEAGKICISDDNNYYLALKEINTGIDEVNCVVIPNDNSINYYKLSNGLIFEMNKYGTYYINNYNLVNGLDSTQFFSHAGETGLWKEANGNSITCNSGKCESLTKIPSCSYDFQTGKCKVSGGSLNAGQFCISSLGNYYLSTEKISSSTPGGCVRHETAWGYSLGSSNVSPDYSNAAEPTSEKLYISTYHVIENKMYELTNYNEVYIKNEGLFIIDDANKKVSITSGKSVDISKDSLFKLYVCTSAGCKQKVSCAAGINYEYMYDENSGNIIKCDPKTNTISYASSGSYFLNGPWEDLIDCTTGSCVERNSDNGMEGYYLDSGNTDKIIKCIRDNGKFKCINEDAIACDFDSKEGTCGSKVNNLLRNSYCYHIQKDAKTGRITDPAKILYVEKFIRAGDEGQCEYIGASDVLFRHYRKSKFLGNKERNEVLKITKEAIVSLYEKDLGYYIISTENGRGITSNTDLNKSRLYECTSEGCKEILEPINDRIYINKASSEKMVRYNGSTKTWVVLKNKCTRNSVNPNQCILSGNGLNKGDIIYIYENEQLKFKASKYSVNTKYTAIDDSRYNDDVKTGVYQYFNNEAGFNSNGSMYILDKSLQFFEPIKDSGMYFFKYSDNYYNLVPYRSTVNTTYMGDVMIYSNDYNYWRRSLYMNKGEGYYWNKADLNGEGLIVEVMNVPEKIIEEEEEGEEVEGKKKREEENVNENKEEETDEVVVEEVKEKETSIENSAEKKKRTDEDEIPTHMKFKSVINKCTSVKKNVCLNKQDGQTILPGSPCVVLEGDYPGLYIATANIGKTAPGNGSNCLRYDDGNTYHYIGANGMKFADERREKILIEVGKNEIVAFTNSNVGYFVIDSDKKGISSTSSGSASAYNCTIEYRYTIPESDEEEPQLKEGTDHLECVTLTNVNKYILSELSSIVLGKNGKWNVETKKGYYFFNEGNLPATTTTDKETKIVTADNVARFIVIGNTKYEGTYLNSAVTDNVVVVQNTKNRYTIEKNYKACTYTAKDNTCKPKDDDELSSQEVCYDSSTKKLYVIDVIEQDDGSKKTMCYTGSEKLKYRFINDILYRLDGTSVQELNTGYYVLNEKWEEYSSTYPEVPFKIIKCNDRCEEVEPTAISIDADVLINQAGTGVNKLLKYYKNSGKFANISKPGFYFLNDNNGVSKDSGYNDYINNNYVLSEAGVISTASNFNYNNIYINYAKEGALTKNLSEFDGTASNVVYNAKTDSIEYNGKTYDGEDENVIIRIDGYLYKQKSKYLEVVENGLYALTENEPFTETKWTSLSVGTGICYYVNGGCDSSKLAQIKKEKYSINLATKKPSIIEYSSAEDQWRMVSSDGVYFFFEDGYNIDKTNRRIERVYEVVEGEAVDITESENRIGYYSFNGLMVESNETDGWEDAKPVLTTVNIDAKKVCTTYEKDEVIDNEKFCFNSELNSICVARSVLSNEGDQVNNCIFGETGEIYYFLIGEKLYSVSDYAYRHIRKSGIYVISTSNKIYKDKLENKANAYHCKDGKCNKVISLESGYYLNMADSSVDKPIILYYDSATMTWRKTSVDGDYFFNEMGYAVGDEEEIQYAYSVSKNGNEVDIIKNYNNGIYISQSSISDEIVVENKDGQWTKAKKVPTCKIDEDRKVTSSAVMKTGDVCIDQKRIVLISKSSNDNISEEEGKKERRQESGTYEGISADSVEKKYSYQSNDNSIAILEKGNVRKLGVTGYVVLDKSTNEPLVSDDPIEALIYKCNSGKCNEVDTSKAVSGTIYINTVFEEKPLVQKSGEDNLWSVVTTEGYYFFDANGNKVSENSIVAKAYEVMEGGEQIDITSSNEIGYYFNKIGDVPVIVGNEKDFWSKGSNVRKCNITNVEEGTGMNCRSLTPNEVVEAGDYCYDPEGILYVMIGEGNEDNEEENCVAGSNDEPKYITSERISTLNGVDVGTKLVELTDNSIKVVSPGIYILNENGTIINENNNGEVESKVYICTESDCTVEEMEADVMFLSESGEIFVMKEEGALTKVEKSGLYFFKSNGLACEEENDEVERIIEITEDAITEIELDAFESGAYINNANNKTVGIYENGEWSLTESECKFIEETGVCTSEGDLEVGSYCIVDGDMYFVNAIEETEDGEIMKCIPGDDSNPLYFITDDELIAVKKTSVSVIKEEGYYAMNAKTFEALESDVPVRSRFIKCDEDGICKTINKAEKSSNYLNKAVTNSNIVKFESGSVKEAVTSETHCSVNGNVCSVEEGELASGDLCVADNSLYIVKEGSECIKAEKYIISYQMIGNKMYKIGTDAVVQKFDGYYFVNGNHRAINAKEDYSNPDTVGYMCSVSGECYEIDPDDVKYYKDYVTEEDGHFTVVKYDPEKKTKRQEEDSSGYEVIKEEGIFKLDDGSYVECEMEKNGDISCKEIDHEGSMMTNDNELLLCVKNDKKEVECTQATKGGYYMVNDELLECEASEDGEKLDCDVVQKEGYFLGDGQNTLYKCVENVPEVDEDDDELGVSSLNGGLLNVDGYAENIDSIKENEENGVDSLDVELIRRRKRQEENDSNVSTTDATETGDKPTETISAETGTSTTIESSTPTPVDVVCKPEECTPERIINNGSTENPVDLYVCKKVEKTVDTETENSDETKPKDDDNDDDENEEEDEDTEEEEEKVQWIAKNCDSGNFRKEKDNYYNCEDEKEGMDESKIPKPNTDHTSTEKTGSPKTKTTKSVESTTTPVEEVTTTTPVNTSSEPTTNSSSSASSTKPKTTDEKQTKTPDKATITTTTKTTTTTTTKATTTTTAPSGTIPMKSIPSMAFYILLFIMFALNLRL